jgi:DNA-binding LacI/PurR family transcriptional regulator
MRDVAREAGVSQSLVSIVFRDAPGAGEQTRERVLEVARRLGYVRDESARSLRSTRPLSIGVCFRLGRPFHDAVLEGLYRAVAGTPYRLVLSAVSGSRAEEAALDDLEACRCGALLVIGSLLEESELSVRARRIPLVSVARRCDSAEIDWVVSDDEGGMDRAVAHLQGLGHESVTYLSCPGASGGEDRERAFRKVAQRLGLVGGAQVRVGGESEEEEGVRIAEEMVAAGDVPSAIIASNDSLALGVLGGLLRHGVGVPERVSVIGMDDLKALHRPRVKVTALCQDTSRLADLAIGRALRRLSPVEGRGTRPRGTILPMSLEVRDTTGPAAIGKRPWGA